MREYLIPAPFVQIDAGVSEESRRLSTWLASVRREASRSVVLGWRDERKKSRQLKPGRPLSAYARGNNRLHQAITAGSVVRRAVRAL